MKSLLEEVGSTYHLGKEGMHYPDLTFPEEEIARFGKLISHLNEFDNIAKAKSLRK